MTTVTFALSVLIKGGDQSLVSLSVFRTLSDVLLLFEEIASCRICELFAFIYSSVCIGRNCIPTFAIISSTSSLQDTIAKYTVLLKTLCSFADISFSTSGDKISIKLKHLALGVEQWQVYKTVNWDEKCQYIMRKIR